MRSPWQWVARQPSYVRRDLLRDGHSPAAERFRRRYGPPCSREALAHWRRVMAPPGSRREVNPARNRRGRRSEARARGPWVNRRPRGVVTLRACALALEPATAATAAVGRPSHDDGADDHGATPVLTLVRALVAAPVGPPLAR